MVRRVALVGQNNSRSKIPAKALSPEYVDSTGWNLWKLTEARTGATQEDYQQAFHRYCLGTELHFHTDNARQYWSDIESDLLAEFNTVVLVGTAVRNAASLLLPRLYVSRTLICIPTPSIYSLWYTQGNNKSIVELIFEELYFEAVLT